MNKKKAIKVVRYANEGFQAKPYTNGPTSVFLDVLITDLSTRSKIISFEESTRYESNPMKGCFCYITGFDEMERDEILRHRKNDKENIRFFNENEIVFVRNTYSDERNDRFVEKVDTGKTDSVSGAPILEALGGFSYEFVKMPLRLAKERLGDYLNKGGKPNEFLSEIYVTEDQI